MEKAKVIKIVKGCVFAALCLLEAFLLYSVIGNLTVWFSQPRFVSADGSITTASLGFFIQFLVFSGFFLVVTAALIVVGILFFKKKKI